MTLVAGNQFAIPSKKTRSEAERWSTYNPGPTPDAIQDPVPYSDGLILSIQERLETEEQIRRRKRDETHRKHVAAQIEKWSTKISRSLLEEGKATFVDTHFSGKAKFCDKDIFGPVARSFLDQRWAVKWTAKAFLVAPPSTAMKENKENYRMRWRQKKRTTLVLCSWTVLLITAVFGVINLLRLVTGRFTPWITDKPFLVITACVWVCVACWIFEYSVDISLDDPPDPTPWELPIDSEHLTVQGSPTKRTRATHD